MDGQGASSAQKSYFGKMKILGLFSLKAELQSLTKKVKSQDLLLTYTRNEEVQCTWGRAVLHPRSQGAGEREQITNTHYLKDGWSGGHELFAGSLLNGYFKRCSSKSTLETFGHNLKLRSSSKTPSVNRVVYCKMTNKQLKCFFFIT